MERGNLFNAKIILLCILVFLSFHLILGEEVGSEIQINNAPPFLITLIPNQTAAQGESIPNTFNLNNYFVDDNGDVLTFTYSNVEDITITIDSYWNVSFLVPSSFSGIRSVIFLATDGVYNTSSNLVFINIGVDNESPQWTIYGKNKNSIYQNNYVNFTSSWTDNFGLKGTIFSINQGQGWENSSLKSFTGKSNSSVYKLQIKASPGSEVSWMFYAYDLGNNVNSTNISFFNILENPETDNVSSKNTSLINKIAKIITPKKNVLVENFSLDQNFFLVSLKQGESRTKILRITNIGTTILNFNLSSSGLQDYILFSQTEFFLNPGEFKDITIDFTAPDIEPGQYMGYILISSSYSKQIPVIFEINYFDFDMTLSNKIPENYKIVKPGKTVATNITIVSVKDIKLVSANLYLAIKNFEGDVLEFREDKINFTSSFSLLEFLNVSSELSPGKYIIYARVKGEKEKIVIASDIFEVGEKFNFSAYLKSGAIFISITIFSFLVVLLMVSYRRIKGRKRVLQLYLILTELKKLLEKGNYDEAINLYIRLKNMYGLPISKEALTNKEILKKEVLSLSEKLSEQNKKQLAEISKIEKPSETNIVPEKKEPLLKDKKIEDTKLVNESTNKINLKKDSNKKTTSSKKIFLSKDKIVPEMILSFSKRNSLNQNTQKNKTALSVKKPVKIAEEKKVVKKSENILNKKTSRKDVK